MRWVWLACAACAFHRGAASQPPSVDAPPDLPTDVALDIAAAGCPIDYTITLATTASRYRIISTEDTFAIMYPMCSGSGTHLASFETAGEGQEMETVLDTYLPAAPSNGYFIGAVQAPGQSLPDASWFVYTGGPLPPSLWVTGEPDDSGGGENDEENTATLNRGTMVHDTNGTIVHGAICECDGLPIDPTVATYIQ